MLGVQPPSTLGGDDQPIQGASFACPRLSLAGALLRDRCHVPLFNRAASRVVGWKQQNTCAESNSESTLIYVNTNLHNITRRVRSHIRGHTPTDTVRTTAGRADAPLRKSTAFEARTGALSARLPTVPPPRPAPPSPRADRAAAPRGTAGDPCAEDPPARTPTTGRASCSDGTALALHDPANASLDPANFPVTDAPRPLTVPRRREVAFAWPPAPLPRPPCTPVIPALVSPACRTADRRADDHNCSPGCPPGAGVVVGEGCAEAYASLAPAMPEWTRNRSANTAPVHRRAARRPPLTWPVMGSRRRPSLLLAPCCPTIAGAATAGT